MCTFGDWKTLANETQWNVSPLASPSTAAGCLRAQLELHPETVMFGDGSSDRYAVEDDAGE